MTSTIDSPDSKAHDEVIASSDLSSFIKEKDGTFRVELTTGKSDSSPSAIKKFALFRLGHDLYECRKDPLPMIAAEPLHEDTNLFEWHANLVGPPQSSYEDICFHFKIKIPQSYPAAPPKIEICSYFEHPNVFGRWICLDMLQGQWIPDDKSQSHKDVGYGWTPAYTMQSILVQLQAFLFDAVDTTFWAQISEKYCYTSTTQRSRQQAKMFKCNKCKHTGKKPWPEPECWRDRLRYMVPGKEMPDIAKTKQQFWSFLESVNSLVTSNEWPRIMPLECGSFFSWTLLPWYHKNYVFLNDIKKEKGTKSMAKTDCRVIRGLIHRCITYLHQKPTPPPNKGLMLEKMYRIESALDIAVNNTYSTKNKLRERGYWQWIKKNIATITTEDAKKSTDTIEDKPKEDDGEWMDFPVRFSQQIEALYCRWQSDLRRPGQLVEIIMNNRNSTQRNTKNTKNDKNVHKRKHNKDKKENKQDLDNNIFANGRKYGIITKPKGYHWHILREKNLSDDEKKAKYRPYSKEENRVRVMEINPLRTKQDKVTRWMNGPHFVTGKTKWVKYKIESSKNNKRKYTDYTYKRCMILNRFQDDHGRWYIVVHPMPQRSDINKHSRLIDVDKLKIRSEGTVYKAYIGGEDGKYYVINVEKERCRCIDDQSVYKIRRCIKKRTTNELWKEILIQASGDDVDVPWKEEAKEEIKPWDWNDNGDILDPMQYIGKCAFIDLSMDNLPEPYYSDEEDSKPNDDTTKQIKHTKSCNDSEYRKKITQLYTFPEIGEKVIGKVVKIIRHGMFVDIGYKDNGKDIHGFLHLNEIKCPQRIVNDKLQQYLQHKKDEEIRQKEYEQYLRKCAKKKKKQRRKKALQKKKEANGKENHKRNNEEKHNKEIAMKEPPKPQIKQRAFSLPRCCWNMSQCDIKPGDILYDLYIYDTDPAVNDISLSQFMPLSYLSVGDVIDGRVRSALSYAAFVDVGCESDAFLHKSSLENAFRNRIIFDCSNNLEIGDTLQLVVTNVNCENNKLEVAIDSKSLSQNSQNRLVLPDDFDESIAVYRSIFGLLSDDINDLIFQFLFRGDLHRLRKCCRLFERIIDNKSSLRFEIEELKCFHSKKTFRDEILGFGVKVERYPNSAMICDIEPKLDLLSATSYTSYTVRMNVWKEPFSHWLPVYINKEHGKKSIVWAKRQITEILNDPKYAKEYMDWNPYYVLKIIPTLMNTMVVKTMKGELHESIVALEGYTMFYHLLLAFICEYPFLQDFIDRNLGEFNVRTANNVYRDKKHVKSLGEWIALLSTSNKYSWKDVCTAYLRECFDRNAKWILTANKSLLDENHPPKSRLTKSFSACQVSLKLCMFHVVFLRLFRYSARSGTLQSVKNTKEKLDKLYGRPTIKMRELLQRNVKRIKKIRNWKEFFDGIGIKCPSDDELYDWLIESMRNSEIKGYHKPYWFIKKRKKKSDGTMGGLFDKFDDMGDAWSAKQFGSDVQMKKGLKKKKMSTADLMMADF